MPRREGWWTKKLNQMIQGKGRKKGQRKEDDNIPSSAISSNLVDIYEVGWSLALIVAIHNQGTHLESEGTQVYNSLL